MGLKQDRFYDVINYAYCCRDAKKHMTGNTIFEPFSFTT